MASMQAALLPRLMPIVLLLSVAMGACATADAAVRAQLERQVVPTGDALSLSIESDSRGSSERPDLSPLNTDFDVLGTSTSTEVSFVNGTRSDRTRWMVRLQPRHGGVIPIPSIKVGNEQTEPLTLTVTDTPAAATGQAGPHVIVETQSDVTGKTVYVQQQIPYTVRLYYDDAVRAGQLAAPQPSDAIVEQLGDEKRYTATRDGRDYNVIERHYAITPEKSGALHVQGANFRGTALVAVPGQGGDDSSDEMMNRLLRNTPFANDPFFRRQLRGRGEAEQPVAARGRDLTIDVQARPAAAIGNWLPAESVTLHDSWADDPPQFKAGEPVTRTITVEAKGLAASQIPSLSFGSPANVRLYPEANENQSRTDGDAVYGVSKQRMTYIANDRGQLTVPSITLPWWNTRANAQEVASVGAREFKVAAGSALNASGAAANAAVSATAAGSAATPSSPTVGSNAASNPTLIDRIRPQWKWLAGLAAVMVLVAMIAMTRRVRRRGDRAVSDSTRSPLANRASMQLLQRACKANDAPGAARALLDVARATWPDRPPRGLSELAAHIAPGRARNEVLALDRSLYASGPAQWRGDALWNVVEKGLQPARVAQQLADDGLEPLYP